MQGWQWKRFTCGIWVAGEDSALSASDWAACADGPPRFPMGRGSRVGGDLGYSIDTTAFLPAWRETQDSPVILGEPIILHPPGDGGSISVEDMVEACLSFSRRYPDCTFAFDPKAGGEQLLQRLERELPDSNEFIEFPQMTGRLCGASMRFAELVGAGMIRHPDDPELTAHVLAASARIIGERWRFARPRDTEADRRAHRRDDGHGHHRPPGAATAEPVHGSRRLGDGRMRIRREPKKDAARKAPGHRSRYSLPDPSKAARGSSSSRERARSWVTRWLTAPSSKPANLAATTRPSASGWSVGARGACQRRRVGGGGDEASAGATT